jgi:hypothetical protein
MRGHPASADRMRMPHQHRPIGTPAAQAYEIHVRGRIGPTLLQAFPTMSARTSGGDTVLSGTLPDQSALYGVLYLLESLGLELHEVRQTARRGPARSAEPSEDRSTGDDE